MTRAARSSERGGLSAWLPVVCCPVLCYLCCLWSAACALLPVLCCLCSAACALLPVLCCLCSVAGAPALVADNATFTSELARFSAIWTQISARFSHKHLDDLVFEIYNEPHINHTPFDGHLADRRVDSLNAAGLAAIRTHSRSRMCLVGGRWWAAPEALYGGLSWISGISVPQDEFLIAKFHWYTPNAFCWDKGTHVWPTGDDLSTLNATMSSVAKWSAQFRIPVWMNEYGVTTKQLNDDVGRASVRRGAPRGRASALRWYGATYAHAWKAFGFAMSAWDTNADYCLYGRDSGCGSLEARAFDEDVLAVLHVTKPASVEEQQ